MELQAGEELDQRIAAALQIPEDLCAGISVDLNIAWRELTKRCHARLSNSPRLAGAYTSMCQTRQIVYISFPDRQGMPTDNFRYYSGCTAALACCAALWDVQHVEWWNQSASE